MHPESTTNFYDLCFPNPCKNNGICMVEFDNYKCYCKMPFIGSTCDKIAGLVTTESPRYTRLEASTHFYDPCSTAPCRNNGICKANFDRYECYCKTPYFGSKCEKIPCSSNPCKNGGICIGDSDDFHCYCKAPFFGSTCERIGYIDTTESPRYTRTQLSTISDGEVNGTVSEMNRTDFFTTEEVTINDDCYCGINSLNCYFYQGKKLCHCKENYGQKDGTCVEKCLYPGDCRNGGRCTLYPGGFFCKCPDTYSGDRCQIDLCRSIRPKCVASGAECKLKEDNFVCECPEGKFLSWSSNKCEEICGFNTCMHGTCKTVAGIEKCVCSIGFTGRHCDIKDTLDTAPLNLIILTLSIGIVLFTSAAALALFWVITLKVKQSKQKVLNSNI